MKPLSRYFFSGSKTLVSLLLILFATKIVASDGAVTPPVTAPGPATGPNLSPVTPSSRPPLWVNVLPDFFDFSSGKPGKPGTAFMFVWDSQSGKIIWGISAGGLTDPTRFGIPQTVDGTPIPQSDTFGARGGHHKLAQRGVELGLWEWNPKDTSADGIKKTRLSGLRGGTVWLTKENFILNGRSGIQRIINTVGGDQISRDLAARMTSDEMQSVRALILNQLKQSLPSGGPNLFRDEWKSVEMVRQSNGSAGGDAIKIIKILSLKGGLDRTEGTGTNQANNTGSTDSAKGGTNGGGRGGRGSGHSVGKSGSKNGSGRGGARGVAGGGSRSSGRGLANGTGGTSSTNPRSFWGAITGGTGPGRRGGPVLWESALGGPRGNGKIIDYHKVMDRLAARQVLKSECGSVLNEGVAGSGAHVTMLGAALSFHALAQLVSESFYRDQAEINAKLLRLNEDTFTGLYLTWLKAQPPSSPAGQYWLLSNTVSSLESRAALGRSLVAGNDDLFQSLGLTDFARDFAILDNLLEEARAGQVTLPELPMCANAPDGPSRLACLSRFVDERYADVLRSYMVRKFINEGCYDPQWVILKYEIDGVGNAINPIGQKHQFLIYVNKSDQKLVGRGYKTESYTDWKARMATVPGFRILNEEDLEPAPFGPSCAGNSGANANGPSLLAKTLSDPSEISSSAGVCYEDYKNMQALSVSAWRDPLVAQTIRQSGYNGNKQHDCGVCCAGKLSFYQAYVPGDATQEALDAFTKACTNACQSSL